MTRTDAGQCEVPAEVSSVPGAIDAPVPGTVAEALTRAGQFDPVHPRPLDAEDFWYITTLTDEPPGEAVLVFDGLATTCEVYLNGERILDSTSMFARHEVPVNLSGDDQVAMCFRALAPRLAERGARAAWRPQMIVPTTLKNIRTTLLGRMPSWCPQVHAVGPWRPVHLRRREGLFIDDVRIAARLDTDGTGLLTASVVSSSNLEGAMLRCSGLEAELVASADDRWTANLEIPDVEVWWPHTHGSATLHDITLRIAGDELCLGRTGFRRIEVDTGVDGEGFTLLVNGTPVFCRGAVWTSADIVRLPGDRASYEPLLALAVEAGMNMLRVGGTMTYESPEFFALCDELGLMVWHDFMFANFDYPSDDEFAEQVRAEAEGFLRGIDASPSLTVLCGGSEVHQQVAMLGRPPQYWTSRTCDQTLPRVADRLRPDVPYVRNSPSGGAVPFAPGSGVAHYFGVSAYMRPLGDARRTGVRFASECLAFSNVPQQVTLDAHLRVPVVHDPDWKAAVPRDRGASWDFEDVRDHYVRDLYEIEPNMLRRTDTPHYLELARAVTGEVLTETYAEWRRPKSPCAGALVWTYLDLVPGAGWGLVDSTGLPKPVWYAMRRACRPVQVLLLDEGTGGVDVHVLNETATPLDVVVKVRGLREGRQQVIGGAAALTVPGRGDRSVACTELFGGFFDTNYAYRFGPPDHDVVVATLTADSSDDVIAEAVYFPLGRRAAMHEATPSVTVVEDEAGYALDLATDVLAQNVHIEVSGLRPLDDWFHLVPGTPRRVRLVRVGTDSTPDGVSGSVQALGGPVVHFAGG